jgi:O-methyltransferase
MELTLFQIVNYILLSLLTILVVRYIYIVLNDRSVNPVQWQHYRKQNRISSRLKQMERKYPDKVRFHAWWLQIERLRREEIPGVFVELGVYQGESAEIIHQMDPEREFHLFDTFEGFHASDLSVETGEAATYTPDHFADTNVRAVANRLSNENKVRFHTGYFPETAVGFDKPVAFVNMDVDLYNPTRSGLELFYPRLSPGGVLVVHDYNYKWPGIMKAVDEFLKTIPESPVFIPDKHGSVMIIRNK